MYHSLPILVSIYSTFVAENLKRHCSFNKSNKGHQQVWDMYLMQLVMSSMSTLCCNWQLLLMDFLAIPPGEWAWCFPLLSFIAGGGLLGSFFWCLLASLSKVDWFVDPSMPLYIPIVDWKSLEYLNYFFMKFKFSPKKIKLANWNSIHCYRQIHLGLFSRQKFNPHT